MAPKDDLTGIEEFSRKSESTDAPGATGGHPADNDLFPTSEQASASMGTEPASDGMGDFEPIEASAPSPSGYGSSASIASTPVSTDDLPELSESLTAPADPFPEPGASESDSPGDSVSHSDSDSGPTHALENVRRYAEQVSAKRESAPAAYPFSVLIEGDLRPDERERLIDLLAREGMGIREVDIEPQFESGRILIPRISEYAAVLLIQALRGVQAKITAGPSDEIFSTPDTRDEGDTVSPPKSHKLGKNTEHPAESMPITAGPAIPWIAKYEIVGVLTASATLKSTAVEAESSLEYLELIEALQRELRYRAHHKGATAILDYSVQLTPLQLSRHYRVTVSGTAIKS